MKKIAIIGSGGSGKSTLAKHLGETLHMNVYHLDALFWKPNWVETPKEEQRRVQYELVKKEGWIFDGNYSGTMDIRLQAADTIIFLDIPRMICMFRAVKSVLQYRNQTKSDMGEGCEERFSLQFLQWIWGYPKTKKPGILQKLEKLSREKEIIIFRSSREVREFLESVEKK